MSAENHEILRQTLADYSEAELDSYLDELDEADLASEAEANTPSLRDSPGGVIFVPGIAASEPLPLPQGLTEDRVRTAYNVALGRAWRS